MRPTKSKRTKFNSNFKILRALHAWYPYMMIITNSWVRITFERKQNSFFFVATLDECGSVTCFWGCSWCCCCCCCGCCWFSLSGVGCWNCCWDCVFPLLLPLSLPPFLRFLVFLREYDASNTPFLESIFFLWYLFSFLTVKVVGSKLNVESSRWSSKSFLRSCLRCVRILCARVTIRFNNEKCTSALDNIVCISCSIHVYKFFFEQIDGKKNPVFVKHNLWMWDQQWELLFVFFFCFINVCKCDKWKPCQIEQKQSNRQSSTA